MSLGTKIATRLPGMSVEELTTLKANADRLAGAGTAAQKTAVVELSPLLDAELAARSKIRQAERKVAAKARTKKTVAASAQSPPEA